MFRDDFETPSGEIWGDLLRLHHRWGTPTLGVSLFLSCHLSSAMFTILAIDSLLVLRS